MRVATSRRTMRIVTFVIASTTLMSCLVTDSIDNTQPRNLPSSVVTAPGGRNPLDHIVQINRTEVTEDLEFDVIIRDANVKSTLQTQVFVFRRDGTPSFQQLNIIPATMTESVDRSTTIRVPIGFFNAGDCLKVELLVSQEFESDTRMPVEMGDVHSAVWWVAVTASGGEPIDMRGCTQ
ncbi:MAG: hypothetical protein ACI9KE_004174 [Polyangiales bacterium]|jgi:hypothetical protein